MSGKTVIGLRMALAGFTVVLLMTGIPAASQDTSMRSVRPETGIPAASQATSIPVDSQETSIRMPRYGTSIRPDQGSESVVWNFGAIPNDGQGPTGVIADAAGNLYGTTKLGGTNGQGTVFRMYQDEDGNWHELQYHSFGDFNGDGIQPAGRVVLVNGSLWGVTNGGGQYGDGTVWQISPACCGSYTYSYSTFQGNQLGNHDGRNPLAGLTADASGNLYGTTYAGGQDDLGTVFKMYYSQGILTRQNVWSFSGPNGASPVGNVDLDPAGGGSLVGTTSEGGFYGKGTLFVLLYHQNGPYTFRLVHSFGNGMDGATPSADLAVDRGHTYGTTLDGGDHHSGTVFKVDYREELMYSFGHRGDGINPLGGLLAYGGSLYGTTQFGGDSGEGTVFKESTGGGEDTIVWSFGSGDDGAVPQGNLIVGPGGKLYGATTGGGQFGDGTIFAIAP